MLAGVLLVIAIGTSSQLTMIVAVIASGSLLAINNTLVTTVVMTVAPAPRPVASAAYGFVRIIGGGLAPFAAGKLAEHYNVHRLRSELHTAAAAAAAAAHSVVAAVDGSGLAVEVIAAAAGLAAELGCSVDVIHVQETDVIGDQAVEAEPVEDACRSVEAPPATPRRRRRACARAPAPKPGRSWRRRPAHSCTATPSVPERC